MNYQPTGGFQPQSNTPQPGAAPAQNPGPQPAPIYTPNVPTHTQNPTNPGAPGAGNPNPAAPTHPGQQVPYMPDPNVAPGQTANPVNFERRYNDQQRYVTQLEQEKVVSYETIEQQTHQISHLENRLRTINFEIDKQLKNVSNPNVSEHAQRMSFDIARDLKADRDKVSGELQNISQSREQATQQITAYEQNLQRAQFHKAQTLDSEVEALLGDQEMLQVFGGDPVQVANFVYNQVVQATAQPGPANDAYVQYLQNRMSLKQLVNVVLEPRRNSYQTAYNKRSNNVGGAIPGMGAQPVNQAPAPSRGNSFFSVKSRPVQR